MKENKEKAVTSGDEDVQVQDDTTPVIHKPASQTGKRKTISSSVNLGDLPSRRGSKKPKPSKNPLPKVPKFTSQTVDLDKPVINVMPVQTIPPVQTDPPLPTKTSRRPHPFEPSKEPPNLVLDEGYAWRTFKGIITDNEVNSCYNMSVKDFERSAIHDLFKVYKFHSLLFYSILYNISNFPSSKCRPCQSSTQRPPRLRSYVRRLRRLERKIKS